MRWLRWRSPYHDPTYIHWLFYFITRLEDLVADFNALAQAMAMPPSPWMKCVEPIS